MSTYDEGTTVMDLERVRVSEWFRQDRDSSNLGGVKEETVTNSFALRLHPTVIAIAAGQLTGQIANIDAQLKSSPSATALVQRRGQLERCLNRLKQHGSKVASFSFLGGECLDVLPRGTAPPAG